MEHSHCTPAIVSSVGKSGSKSDVVAKKILKPDPGLVKMLGANHSLPTAVADLVDNSIDATARQVVISFESSGGTASGLTIADNGWGMSSGGIDNALTLGLQRDYKQDDHGHFGIGLKAAAFSQADTLTIFSSPGKGEFHGRRLRKKDFMRDYSCEVLDPEVARREISPWLDRLNSPSGTLVRLSDTKFPRFAGTKFDAWLDRVTSDIRMHLGIVYHIILDDAAVNVKIELYDSDISETGAPQEVKAIDPFGFSATAVSGYPKTLIAKVGEDRIKLRCHIVPPKSSGPQYRLYGANGGDFQGFYVYRNRRLLQVGGWDDVSLTSKSLALARIAIGDLEKDSDNFDILSPHLILTPEKSITFRDDLRDAISVAKKGAITFAKYLDCAEGVLTESRKRIHARRPVVAPGKGLHEEVRRVICEEIPLRKNESPIEIRWRRLEPERFMLLDKRARTIYLNQRYRDFFTGGWNGLSDAPVLKSLVYLLAEGHFEGDRWGSRDKDLIEVWDSVLGAAIQTETAYREGRSGEWG
jgi:hypothetical protein